MSPLQLLVVAGVGWLLVGALLLVQIVQILPGDIVWQGVTTAAGIIGPPAVKLLNQTWSRSEEDTTSFKLKGIEKQLTDMQADIAQIKTIRQAGLDESMVKSLNQTLPHCVKDPTSFKVQGTEEQLAALEAELTWTKTTVKSLQTELEQTKMTLQAERTELAKTTRTVTSLQSELEQTEMTLQAERMKLAQSKRTVTSLQAELEETKMTLQADRTELAQTKRTVTSLRAELEQITQRHEAMLAELRTNVTSPKSMGQGEVRTDERPTGVFAGPWGNVVAAHNSNIWYSGKVDCSSFRYFDDMVTGSIEFTVTSEERGEPRIVGKKGTERFTGVWDVTTQTITGHGVSVSDRRILSVSKKYVLQFNVKDGSVMIADGWAKSLLTKVAEI